MSPASPAWGLAGVVGRQGCGVSEGGMERAQCVHACVHAVWEAVQVFAAFQASRLPQALCGCDQMCI
jgi:hypothetical protein